MTSSLDFWPRWMPPWRYPRRNRRSRHEPPGIRPKIPCGARPRGVEDAMSQSADPQQAARAQMRAVTISREYGSGGGEIAARLARQLGWRLVDHEVVAQVARALGVSEAEAAAYDEH